MPEPSTAFPVVTLVGHHHAPIGMGENARNMFRALRSVARTPRLLDVFQLTTPDRDGLAEFAPFESRMLSDINIFHINGDEVEPVLAHIGGRSDGYDIVYPQWELSRYPDVWARQLERFDEIWAPSSFTRDSIAGSTTRPVLHVPLACEVTLSSFLGRRYFGIPEASYAFLFFFDLRSYYARKNPDAVIAAFRALLRVRPRADVVLVIKVSGAASAPDRAAELESSLADIVDRTVFIDRSMSDNEVKNLVRCCDCFVSLHRSEGFGFGLAEAMCLGKPAIGTAYSGNLDFMVPDASFLVGYRLIEVADDAYPHWSGQVWADASVDQAIGHMVTLVDSPATGAAMGERAGRHLRTHFGHRPTGMKIVRRLDEIGATLGAALSARVQPVEAEDGLTAKYVNDPGNPVQ